MAPRATFRLPWKPGLHRIYRDRIIARRALLEVTAAVAILSLDMKSVRLKQGCVNTKPPRKYFVKSALNQGTWRPIPISTESLIKSAVRPTPSLDLI